MAQLDDFTQHIPIVPILKSTTEKKYFFEYL